MFFITQLIYIEDGQENLFYEFEDHAIPIISKYNGRLLLRLRPTEASYISYDIDLPDEIHLVGFETEQDFYNFTKDEERKQFLDLKEQSIKSVLLIKGTDV
jgi:uncharacterized protein (DUF1330 family)